ncbi:MAG: thioredoxin family protein, partial [Sedimentisphaerales bacterium]|nr:thioredoxin family protein [Sedimentisphaerales bacterium]
TAGMSKIKLHTIIVLAVCVLISVCTIWGQNSIEPNSTAGSSITTGIEMARHEQESSSVRIEPARMGQQNGIAIVFTGTDDLHYYAKPETATAPGFELKVTAKSAEFDFGEAVFPKWKIFTDPLGSKVEVYVGDFTVFVPITSVTKSTDVVQGDIEVLITGQACTSKICLLPFEKTLQMRIDWSGRDSWKQINLESEADAGTPVRMVEGPDYSTWFALVLAFVAGLGLNIMPCVWPILPLIIMRIVDQAKAGRRQSVMMGLAFCIGILLFFVCLAGANIILQSFYDRSLNWGDHLRNPTIVTALALLMIVMALFMFGIFTITVPSSIASKSGSGEGYVGSVGMGFLAAILSTPCSFGVLTVAFVWAQGQPLALGTLAIMVIGLGMAAPYAILTFMPGWLKRLPKGGRWMELFKQTLGFVLLVIAVKLIKAAPAENRINLLYFAVVLSFCVWIWGTWVTYSSKFSRKILVRGIAVLLVVLSFWFFFRPVLVDWQDYDPARIESAKAEQTPVLIKFTADWCTNCEVVDKFVFGRKDVAKLIDRKGVLAVKGDTTKATQPATHDLSNVYKEPGVPVTLLFLPGETEPVRLHELFFADKLKELLDKLPDKG